MRQNLNILNDGRGGVSNTNGQAAAPFTDTFL